AIAKTQRFAPRDLPSTSEAWGKYREVLAPEVGDEDWKMVCLAFQTTQSIFVMLVTHPSNLPAEDNDIIPQPEEVSEIIARQLERVHDGLLVLTELSQDSSQVPGRTTAIAEVRKAQRERAEVERQRAELEQQRAALIGRVKQLKHERAELKGRTKSNTPKLGP